MMNLKGILDGISDDEWAESLRMLPERRRAHAKAIEAQRAETTQIGSVADESAVPQGFAQTPSPSGTNQ